MSSVLGVVVGGSSTPTNFSISTKRLYVSSTGGTATYTPTAGNKIIVYGFGFTTKTNHTYAPNGDGGYMILEYGDFADDHKFFQMNGPTTIDTYQSIYLMLPYPVVLNTNETIRLTGPSFTAGACTTFAFLYVREVNG